jgi:hypothetical protein
MNNKLRRIVFPIISFIALVALACTCGGSGGLTSPTDTPEPPTKAAPPTKPPVEVPTQSAISTKPPIGGTTGGGNAGPIVLSSTPYTHPSGAFSISFPEGWNVTEYDNSARADSPDGAASVQVYVENAGVQLSADELTNYANAIEQNFYGSYSNYVQSSVEPQQDGSTGIFKTLDSDGITYDVSTYYWQHGTALFVQDWWVRSDQYDALSDGLVAVSNSMSWNGNAASSSELYPLKYTFTCPNNLCTFSAPYGWSYGHDETSFNFTINDKFSSPDGRTFIDSTIYDDGSAISKSVAGQFALGLLKEFYAKDIVVVGDEVQSDGSERLDWKSPGGGYSGESFFETRGTTFLMWTWVVNSDYFDLYDPLWNNIVGSYTIP